MIRNVFEIFNLVTEILIQTVGKSFVKILHVPFYIKSNYYSIFFFVSCKFLMFKKYI